jgi:hypothetical protein
VGGAAGASRGLALHQRLEDVLGEHIGADGAEHETHDARLLGRDDLRAIGLVIEHEHGRAAPAGLVRLHEDHAVHARHRVLHDDQVRVRDEHLRHRVLPVGRLDDIVVAKLHEHGTMRLSRGLVVIDEHDLHAVLPA